ncbi:MAG: flagellar hook-basal body protein [Lachnospiraceae bacterium]|jgi:flagellar basal-body rod protein FlgG|nr:flagellar hook-basal body protein [Lachnospiraceae bacterium]
MVRSLWSAATGMRSQQVAVDVIANNLANVNSVGYKSEKTEFKSLLYQTLQTKTTSSDGSPKPVTAQVGLGVRNSSIKSIFTQGNMTATDSTSAFAIQGKGFFAVQSPDGATRYTRNGDFTWALTGTGVELTTSDGYPVLDTNGRAIRLTGNYNTSMITITREGTIMYPDAGNNPQSLGITIGLYQFQNPEGLEHVGDTSYVVSPASGQAMNEATTAGLQRSSLAQGYLEYSNVNVGDEMVNLIIAQRAYEMNSKAITTTDTMMELANNLKR